ncbi:MAG: nicotinamide riboside transporter PnuC [Christensenellaceae bacterium]|jgi:nicotinamide mononucleotide transporter|nr:nicotinamide riboside transporter PnuC [Christensenellaceae bacterium]
MEDKQTAGKKRVMGGGYSALDLFLLIFGLATITTLLIVFQSNWLTVVCSVLGVLGVFMQAKGKIIAQFFCVSYAIFYIFLAFSNQYFGEVIVYAGFMVPLFVYGIIHWLKNRDKKDNTVIVRRNLSIKEWIGLGIMFPLVFVGVYFLLKFFNTAELIVSAISSVLVMLAVYLSVRRVKLNQIVFLLNDFAMGALWMLVVIKGDLSLIPFVTICLIYAIYDIYGLIQWAKLEKRQRVAAEIDSCKK